MFKLCQFLLFFTGAFCTHLLSETGNLINFILQEESPIVKLCNLMLHVFFYLSKWHNGNDFTNFGLWTICTRIIANIIYANFNQTLQEWGIFSAAVDVIIFRVIKKCQRLCCFFVLRFARRPQQWDNRCVSSDATKP